MPFKSKITDKMKEPAIVAGLKQVASVAGALMTILGLWFAFLSHIEGVIDDKNKEMLTAIDQRFQKTDEKIQDNTAVVIGVLANDYRDRLTLVDYEIQQRIENHQAIPFNLYTQKKQLEENLESVKKWQN